MNPPETEAAINGLITWGVFIQWSSLSNQKESITDKATWMPLKTLG